MRMELVEEMPIHHTHWCQKGDEIKVLAYNKNDVEATYEFLLVTLGKTDYPLYKGKNKLQLRNDLNKKFHVNVTNMGDVPMGEELMLQLYSREVGVNPYLLKKSGGSATELFRNNFIKKSNTNKNIPEMDNIKDQIGYIFSTNGSANKVFLSPQNSKGQKIIFLKNEKNKKEPKDKSRKNSKNNSSAKDSKKKALTQKNEKNLDLDDINMNLDEKNKSVQYLLRNTYNNVKI